VLAATGGKGVDVVVDMLSGPVVAQTMKATAILGRIVNVGVSPEPSRVRFRLHALRRIDYIGVTFRTRSLEEVREIGRRCAPICGRGHDRQADAADRPPFPARPGGGGAGAHARQQAFRQDRTDDVSCARCRATVQHDLFCGGSFAVLMRPVILRGFGDVATEGASPRQEERRAECPENSS